MAICYLCKRERDLYALRPEMYPMCGLGPKEGIAHRCGNDTQVCRSVFKAGLTLTLLARPLAEPKPQPMFTTPEPVAMTRSDCHQPMAVHAKPSPKPQAGVIENKAGKVLSNTALAHLVEIARKYSSGAIDVSTGRPESYYGRTYEWGMARMVEGFTALEVADLCKLHKVPILGVASYGQAMDLLAGWSTGKLSCGV